jgi:catechol 2,3-dioxygenase-like lactoylglutathione lyase family enzyme
MTIRRAVPDITSADPAASSAFYQLLGFREEMNLGWVVNLVSPSSPAAQVILITRDAGAAVNPDLSVEVEDVDAAYEAVRATGAQIVHPITDEEWGVRRFFVRDPDGKVVNVVSHRSGDETSPETA